MTSLVDVAESTVEISRHEYECRHVNGDVIIITSLALLTSKSDDVIDRCRRFVVAVYS